METARLELLIDLRRYREAEVLARECLAAEPEWAQGYTHLARVLSALGRMDEALEAARTAVRMGPHNAFGQAFLGHLYLQTGKLDEARVGVREALRLSPSYPWAYYLGSRIEELQKNHEVMLKWCEDGLAQDPNSELLLHQRGWALKNLLRNDDALDAAAEGLRRFPGSAMMHNLRGCVYYNESANGQRSLWRFRAAEASFREALRIEPGEKAYRENRDNNLKLWREYFTHRLGLAIYGTVGAINVVMLFTLKMSYKHSTVQNQLSGLLTLWLVSIASVFISFAAMVNKGEMKGHVRNTLPLKRFGVPSMDVPYKQKREAWRILLFAAVSIDFNLLVTMIVCWVL